MFSLFRCGRKKAEAITAAAAWLEANFPGQFELLQTKSNATWVRYVPSEYKILLSAKADRDIQFLLLWDKAQENGGLRPEDVSTALARATREIGQARQLLALLKTHGLDQASVGVSLHLADVMIYADPAPAKRETLLRALQAALTAWSETRHQHIKVFFMEEKSFGEAFQQFVPEPLIHATNAWKQANELYALDVDWSAAPTLAQLSRALTVNTHGRRSDVYRQEAYRLAVDWAGQHLKKPVILQADDGVEYSLDQHDGLAIRFRFPYCIRTAATEADSICSGNFAGYVCGSYHTERGTWKAGRVEGLEE